MTEGDGRARCGSVTSIDAYWPDTGATGQLLTELAEDLVSVHGMDVTVVTGYPLAQNGHAVASLRAAQRRPHPARARHHVLAAIVRRPGGQLRHLFPVGAVDRACACRARTWRWP